MSSRGVRLATNTSIFAAGTVSTQIVALVTVPFVTAQLSPGEYGSVDLLITVVSLMLPLASLGISEAVVRFGMDQSFILRDIISSGVAIALVGFMLCLAVLPLINTTVGSESLVGVGAALLLTLMAREVAGGYLRAANRIGTLVAGGVAQSLLLALGLFLFMGLHPGGRTGYLLALLLSNFVVSAVFTTIALTGGRFSLLAIKRETMVRMLRYSVPLVPNALLWLAVASVSRFFLLASQGEESVGLYAVAVRITSVIVGMTSVFMQAWQLSAIEERHSTDRETFESDVFAILSGALFVGASALLLCLKPLMNLVFSDRYFDAWTSVPPLLFGVIFLAFATFAGTQYKVMMVTSRALWTSLLGAVTVVALSALIVPTFGVVGAGVATCGGYLVLWLVRVADVGLPFRTKKQGTVFITGLALVALQGSLLYSAAPSRLSLGVGSFLLVATVTVNLGAARVVSSMFVGIIGRRNG